MARGESGLPGMGFRSLVWETGNTFVFLCRTRSSYKRWNNIASEHIKHDCYFVGKYLNNMHTNGALVQYLLGNKPHETYLRLSLLHCL